MSKILATFFFLLIAALTAFAQTVQENSFAPPTLESIITESDKQAQVYRETFRDLIADEKKTFVEFDKIGSEKKSTSVESDYLVYQSAKTEGEIGELRNILRVDGKTVPDAQARADRLQAELRKTDTADAELEKIAGESSRYDKTFEIDGLTLYEGIILSEYLRPYFDFKLVGTENFDGNEVYVIEFRQSRSSPYITFNGKNVKNDKVGLDFELDLPGKLKKENTFVRGRFYVDAKTFQIRREIREVAVGSSNPISVLTTIFDYAASDYGILVPKKISLISNRLKKNAGSGFDAVKDMEITFDYSRFRKSDVDIQILDDEEKAP